MTTAWTTRAACAALTVLAIGAAHAQDQEPALNPHQKEMQAAFEEAKRVAKEGPVKITLGTQATLDLPEGYSYIPQPAADRLMKAMGNGNDPERLGLIFPHEQEGFIDARFVPSGYIKDDEARNWKVDELLTSLKEGTEEGNKERALRGIPEMAIVGWSQKPTYDQATHRLMWAIETQDKDGKDPDHGVNYNTYVLGREGYLSMDLVSGLKELPQTKPLVQTLLTNTHFNSGKTYADFNSSTDKVAEYGIAALVTGIAVKKLGLFALIGAFALKFFKLIAVGVVAFGAAIRKFFKRGEPQA